MMSIFDINSSQNISLIPPQDSGAVSGSTFIQNNMSVDINVRENNILQEFLSGNIPDFTRKFVPITVSDGTNTISYLVMPDVLSIGNNDDYVRMPMNPHTAQSIADKYDCTLPTKKMVDDIWKNSVNKLIPLPWGPPYDSSMSSTSRIIIENNKIQAQLSGKDFTALTSGHKKDVVLTNQLYPNNPHARVAIYGWIEPDGQAIQGLNSFSHADTYEDYSHGIRLIANDVMVNGNLMRMSDVFNDASLSKLVNEDGILKFCRY